MNGPEEKAVVDELMLMKLRQICEWYERELQRIRELEKPNEFKEAA